MFNRPALRILHQSFKTLRTPTIPRRREGITYRRSAYATRSFSSGSHSVISLHSSSNFVVFATVSVVAIGLVAIAIQDHFQATQTNIKPTSQALILDDEEAALMASDLLPGRPGNLTTEQEAKLKEFWIALFHVFKLENVPDGNEKVDTRPESQKANEEDDKKAKPKRKGFFGSRHEDSKNNSSASLAQGDDKYGQNKELHRVLETSSAEDLRQAFWSMVKCDNPDALLLRFLRARKWNVQNALAMLVATIQWRLAEVKVDSDIVKHGELGALLDSESADAAVKKEGHDFLEQLHLGKSFLHGTDKDGRPMCFVRVRLHKAGEQSEKSLERYTVYTIETARLLLHDNIDTAAIVFDMTDFSLANMDYAPVKFMIKCFEANYPESLGVVLVHKSPWVFQSIWKIIKGWLDPVVAAKVHFTKDLEELSHFVPLDHIPKDMGGKEAWTYSYQRPEKGEDARLEDVETRNKLIEQRALVVQDYEATTLRWLNGHTGDDEKRREELTEKLRTGYWELDPYSRARTLYDRAGVIKPGGHLDFYPSATREKPVANGGPTPVNHDDGGVD